MMQQLRWKKLEQQLTSLALTISKLTKIRLGGLSSPYF
jgi:hypothetical protein